MNKTFDFIIPNECINCVFLRIESRSRAKCTLMLATIDGQDYDFETPSFGRYDYCPFGKEESDETQ